MPGSVKAAWKIIFAVKSLGTPAAFGLTLKQQSISLYASSQ